MQIDNLVIVKVFWFQGSVDVQMGVVKCRDIVTDEIKYYIGAGISHTEEDLLFNYTDDQKEENDIKNIVQWGTKFAGEEFKLFFEGIVDYPVYTLEDKKSEAVGDNIISGIKGTISDKK